MTSLSNWSSEVPSGTSLIRKGDDQIRSEKEVEYNAWEEGHYWDSGSADSGGVHKGGGGGPITYADATSALSAAGDSGRLFYDSTYTSLNYAGFEGVLQFGVPAPYRAYFQSMYTINEISKEDERMAPDKIWVVSVRSVAGLDKDLASATHVPYFAGTDYGPYDGVPLVFTSLASRPKPVAASAAETYYDIRVPSLDSSGCSVLLAVWDQGTDTVVIDPDATCTLHVMSIGTMSSSRIS